MPEPTPRIHQSAADTRARLEDRARQNGVPKEAARKIAETAAREAHTNLDKRR